MKQDLKIPKVLQGGPTNNTFCATGQKKTEDLGKKKAGILASCEGGAPTANL